LLDPPPAIETATPRQEAHIEPLPEAYWNALLETSQPKQPIEEEPEQATELEDIATPAPAITEVTANPPPSGGTADTEVAVAFGTDAGDWAKLKPDSSAIQPGGDGVASGGGGQGSIEGVGLGGDGRSGNGSGSAATGGNGAGSGSGQGIPGGTGASEGAGAPVAAKSPGTGGGPSRAARLVRSRTGAYPAAAREAGIEGTVQVRVQVLADGTVGSVSLGRSSGSKELDDAALQAVKGWTFEPARRDGQPVTSWATVSYRYELRSN
jgi:TonB family protein